MTEQWMINLERRESAKIRLICIPYAGGGSAVFSHWPSLLGDSVQVTAVVLPGREMRFNEPPLRDVEAVLSPLVDAYRAIDSDLPTVFFGHSLGASLAFELAHRTSQDDERACRWLIVSGRQAPKAPRKPRGLYDLEDGALKDELRKLNCTPPEVLANAELMSLLLPRLRADFALADHCRFHEHSTPLGCPITVFGGDQDPHVAPGDLGRWGEESAAATDVKLFRGDHFFIASREQEVLAAVRGVLAQVNSPPLGASGRSHAWVHNTNSILGHAS